MKNTNNNLPFRTKRKNNHYSILIAFISFILILVICVFPFPIHTDLTMDAAELSPDGVILQTGTIHLDVIEYHYLLRNNEVKIYSIQFLDQVINQPIVFPWANYEHLSSVNFVDSDSDSNGYLYYHFQNPAFAIIKYDSRLFVGSTEDNPSFSDIVNQYEVLNFWGLPA